MSLNDLCDVKWNEMLSVPGDLENEFYNYYKSNFLRNKDK